jgi:hypothetical protein
MQIIGKDMIMGWAARKTNFPRVDAVIASVVQTHNWKEAASVSACHLYQISSAMNLNIFEPFTEEQMALSEYLTQRCAGKRLCDYAWRLYAQSVT